MDTGKVPCYEEKLKILLSIILITNDLISFIKYDDDGEKLVA